jgi:hypothetical protein
MMRIDHELPEGEYNSVPKNKQARDFCWFWSTENPPGICSLGPDLCTEKILNVLTGNFVYEGGEMTIKRGPILNDEELMKVFPRRRSIMTDAELLELLLRPDPPKPTINLALVGVLLLCAAFWGAAIWRYWL